MPKCSIRKEIRYGSGFKYRVLIRAFRHTEAMYKFLSQQDNNDWRVMENPLSSGTYIERGLPPELINVKRIDPSALAHM